MSVVGIGSHWGAVGISHVSLPEAFQEDPPKWYLGGLSGLEDVQEGSKCGESGRG